MPINRQPGARRRTLGLFVAAILAVTSALSVAGAATAAPATAQKVAENPVDVNIDANDIAANNVNGLTFKGFGALSGNSSSALLMDYKAQHPDEYAQLLQILFGGSHPLMNQVKIEMGNDRNNSTGPDPATMRWEDEPANVARDPGFQLAADAKKVNPNLKVSILRWNAPAWANTNDKIYDWYKDTILAAYRTYGYMVDYVDPGVNEQPADLAWTEDFANRVHTDTTGYVSDDPSQAGFQSAEEEQEFHQIKIVISDEASVGTFGSDMVSDPTLRNAVDVAAYHYSTDDDSAGDFKKLAQQYDKEVWTSEAQATMSNSDFRPNNNTKDPTVAGTGIGGTGSALEMANTIIKGFVDSNRTEFIYQPAIGSFYEGGQYSFKELVSARDPWSGWMHYDVGVDVLEHFADFAVTGWENSTNTAGIWRAMPQASESTATGTNPVDGRNGGPNYLTLAAPDKSDFSTVIVNDSEYPQTYRITPKNFTFGDSQKLAVWQTRAADDGEAFNANYKQHVADVSRDKNGTYTVSVDPYSIVTATTLDVTNDANWMTPLPVEGTRTVLDSDPASGTLWQDNFDYTDKTVPVIANGGGLSGQSESFVDSRGGDTGTIPMYTWDRNGAFEAVKTADDGWVLRQQVDRAKTGVGGAWNAGDPITGIGDRRWTNYQASVDVKFQGTDDNRYAALGARSSGGSGSASLNGTAYALKLGVDGSWQLLRMGTPVAQGSVAGSAWQPTAWHHLAITADGATITASIDGQQVASYTDSDPYLSGWVDLASSFDYTEFDNLSIDRVPDAVPYYSEYLDDLEMNDLSNPPATKLVYTGDWEHANGAGMYVYQRSTSTTSTKGSSVSYTFTGSGLDLLGANDGTATVDVSVDGTPVAVGAKTQKASDFQAMYSLRGLPWGKHTVTVSLDSGTLVLDAVGVIGEPPSTPASTTALSAALDQAKQVKRSSDFTNDSWKLLRKTIAMAQKAVANPRQYRLDADGASQLIQRLQDASNPLLPKITSLESVDAATWVGAAPTNLPDTVTATLNDGTTRAVPITWHLDGQSFDTPWSTVTVTGSYGSLTTTARVEVVPAGTTAFADIYGTKDVLGYDSPAYTAIEELTSNGLVNGAPDQDLTGGATWGRFATNAAGVSDEQMKSVAPGSYDKMTTTGLYTTNEVGATVGYTLDLPAGNYTISAGSYSWWPSNSRSANVSLTYDGATHQVGTVTLDSTTPSQVLSYPIAHATDGPVTITLTATDAQSPMLSWVGAAKTAS